MTYSEAREILSEAKALRHHYMQTKQHLAADALGHKINLLKKHLFIQRQKIFAKTHV